MNINRMGVNSWDFMLQKLFAEELTKKNPQRAISLKTLCGQEIKT